MNHSKTTCKVLKQIRQEIADANGIDYKTTECTFEGECSGSCPKCESEVRFIERKLSELQKSGRKIIVAGIAASMLTLASGSAMLLTSCGNRKTNRLDGDIQPIKALNDTTNLTPKPTDVLEGDVVPLNKKDCERPSLRKKK